MSNSKARPLSKSPPAPPPRDALSAGFAVAGFCLALYLLITHRTGDVLGCPAGGGCDLVQQSRWSTWFGVPVAAWGAAFYVLVACLAWWHTLRARVDALLVLTAVGFVISLYLTFVTWRELRVTCPYCLASLGLVGALALRAWIQATKVYRVWLVVLAGLIALAGVAVMHRALGGYDKAFGGPENRYVAALADHLKKSGARFYGAYWCPHCQHQKALFGPAADRLPYIECSPHGGPGTALATDCLSAAVRSYPTWRIGNKPYARMLTIAELAALSGFAAPMPEQ